MSFRISLAIRRLLAGARANRIPVIYANDNVGPWRSDSSALIAWCDAHTRGLGLIVPVDTIAGTSAPALRAAVKSLNLVLGARTPRHARSLRFARGKVL